GDGTFRTTNLPGAWWASVASTPGAKMASGDFNGDGRADLVLYGPAAWASIPVAFSNGDGTFNVTNLPNAWWAGAASTAGAMLVTGDFNGDGRSDLALSGPTGWGSIPVAFSAGDGAFNATNLPNAWWAGAASNPGATLVSGDVNGDGRTDLVLYGPAAWTTIPVAFSNGNGTFYVTNVSNAWWASVASTAGAQMVSTDFNA